MIVPHPSPEDLRQQVSFLLRRAGQLQDPLAQARLHQQRATLVLELGDPARAVDAYWAALESVGTYLPALLGLRDCVLEMDDQALAEQVFDRTAEVFDRPETEPEDAQEGYTFFLFVWLLRWPDAARARLALEGLEVSGGSTRAERFEHLCLSSAHRIPRLRRRMSTLDAKGRTRSAGTIGRLLIESPDPPDEAFTLLSAASSTDVHAAWRLVEAATSGRLANAVHRLADGLKNLAGHMAPDMADALRYMAAEQYEYQLGEPAQAAALYRQITTGSLSTLVQLKALLGRIRSRPDPLQFLVHIDGLVLGEPVFDGALQLRAATVLERLGQYDVAWEHALVAHHWLPADPMTQEMIERIAARAGRWGELLTLLYSVPEESPDTRVLRVGIQEHVLDDLASGLAVLDEASTDLWDLRTRQRLARADERVRAWQLEADQLESGERRLDLSLRAARGRLRDNADSALTQLFWILEYDPEHITALQTIAHIYRSARQEQPLMTIITQMIPLIDVPDSRLSLQREFARLSERAGASAEQVAVLLEAALKSRPTDEETITDLERLYSMLQRPKALRRVYEGALEHALPSERRAQLLLQLGELIEREQGVPAEAVGRYTKGLALEPPEPLRGRLMQALARAEAGATPPPLPVPPPVVETTTRKLAPVKPRVQVPMFELDLLIDQDEDVLLDDLMTQVVGIEEESTRAENPPLPKLAPLPELRQRDGRIEGEPTNPGRPDVLAPLPVDLSIDVPLDDEPELDIAQSFLGDEISRSATEDPGRAAIARKLRRSRAHKASSWPDHGHEILRQAIDAVDGAEDLDAKFRALCGLAEKYENHDQSLDAIKAWQGALGYRAGDVTAERSLEALYRRTDAHQGLVDLLARQAHRTGDVNRQRQLLVEVARIEMGPLDIPNAAVDHYRAAVDLGRADNDLLLELAEALHQTRQWDEYVEILSTRGLADSESSEPEAALQLGRVYLYELEQAETALPYILRAARAMPDRVDVAADLAEAQAATGNGDQAVELLKQAIIAAGGSSGRSALRILLMRLARLYEEHVGDLEQALLTWREALKAGVRDPEILERIEHLATPARDWGALAEVLEAQREQAKARDASPEIRRNLAIRLGHLYHRRLRDPRKAAEAFVEAFLLNPTDANVFRVADGILIRRPQPALQIQLYTRLLAHARPPEEQRIAMGLRLVGAYESEGRFEDAVTELQTLGRLAPANPDISGALERVYRSGDRWSELVEMYQRQLPNVSPEERGPIMRRLAHALEVGLRDLPSATRVYQTLLTADPKDLSALRAVARLLEAQRRWGELIQISRMELTLTLGERQQAYIYFRIGSLAETHIHDLNEAKAAYRKALSLDARCFPAIHGLREIAAAAEDWTGVIGNLRQELALWEEPKERAAVLARIAEICEQRLGDRARALSHYREAVEIYPACVPAVRALGNAAFSVQNYEVAAPYFQVLCNQNLDKWPRAARSDVFYKRGLAAKALGRQLEAVESLKLALEFDPSNTEALEALVEVFDANADSAGHAELMTQLDTLYAEHAETGHFVGQARIGILRGHAARQRFDLVAAAAHYQKSAHLCPDDLGCWRPLVELKISQRRWDEATQILRGFSDRTGVVEARVEALMWEGELWSDGAVDPGRGIECYQQVLKINPAVCDAQVAMAQCHYLQGAYTEARTIMEQVVAGGFGDDPRRFAESLAYLGRIHEAFGDEGEARSHFLRALEIDRRCALSLLGLLQLLIRKSQMAEFDRVVAAHDQLFAETDMDPITAALKIFVAGIWLRTGKPSRAKQLLSVMAYGEGAIARDARFALVDVLALDGDIEAAAYPLLQTLDEDICDVHALRALGELLSKRGEDERLLQVLATLEVLGAGTPEELAQLTELEDRDRKIRNRGDVRALPEDLFKVHLAHPSSQSPLLELVRICEPGLSARYPARARPSVRRADLVTGRRHPFSIELRMIQALFAYKRFDLYFVEDQPDTMALWPGNKDLVIVGIPPGDPLTHAHQRFLVARSIGWSRAGLTRLHGLGVERALELMRLLAGLFSARPEPTPGILALIDVLPPKSAEAVDRLVTHTASTTLPAVYTGESVLEGVRRTADRHGLLAAGRLRAACEMMIRMDAISPPPQGSNLTWAVRSNSRLQDLVKYALSESYQQVRRAVGLAI